MASIGGSVLPSAEDWFYVYLPGAAMTLCGSFGASYVLSCLVSGGLPRRAEVLCWVSTGLSLVSICYVLPTYLFAGKVEMAGLGDVTIKFE